MMGMKVIVPTMEILDQATLEQEILEDSREAELLIQLKHLNSRVEAQDTLLAELKEENTVLKIQNQNLLESLNKINSRPSLFRKSSKEFQSLEYQVRTNTYCVTPHLSQSSLTMCHCVIGV